MAEINDTGRDQLDSRRINTDMIGYADMAGLKQIEDWFTYHAPTGDQPQRYERIRSAAKVLARVILQSCPPSADRSAALRQLRETVMTANAAIALEADETTR